MVVRELFGSHRLDVEKGGYVSFDVQPTNSKHKHDYYEICIVLHGAGCYEHGGRTHILGPGTVFLAEPRVVHEITSFETRDLRLFFISFTIASLGSDVRGADDLAVDAFLKAHAVACDGHDLLGAYAPLIEESDGRTLSASRQLVQFALEAMRALTVGKGPTDEEEAPAELDLALAYIDQHLDRRVSAGEVASHLGISERTLRRRFQEQAGTNFVDEVNHRRMRKAAHRLLMGFNVGEVAEFVGFNDPGQFTRAFTRAFDVAPKRFQSNYLPGSLAKKTRPVERDL